MTEPLVRLVGVTKEYRGAETVHALRDVSVAMRPQELCVVHGRSGSGKTTFLNMIGGLDRPTSGSVFVDGIDVAALPEPELVEYRRDTVGFVFQAFGLIPILSAAENVEVPLRLRKVDLDKNDRVKATRCRPARRAAPGRTRSRRRDSCPPWSTCARNGRGPSS